MKIYPGNAAAARSYVAADHGRVDDYYLAEGTGLAERFVDGDGYGAWVAGLDPLSREPRGLHKRAGSDVEAERIRPFPALTDLCRLGR